jgi:hypothetical protein
LIEIWGFTPPVLERGGAAVTEDTKPAKVALIVTVPVPPGPEELMEIFVPATIEDTPEPPPPPVAIRAPPRVTSSPDPITRGPEGP